MTLVSSVAKNDLSRRSWTSLMTGLKTVSDIFANIEIIVFVDNEIGN